MKKGMPMKHKAFVGFMLVSGWAFAQAPAPKPAVEPAKPAVEAAKPMAEAPKPAPAKKSRRSEDARKCLEEPTNNAIIKCAEAYL
jgi:hypothetical protein